MDLRWVAKPLNLHRTHVGENKRLVDLTQQAEQDKMATNPADDQVELFKVKKLIKSLQLARGCVGRFQLHGRRCCRI